MHTVLGTISGQTVEIDRPADWNDGQRVLVIALPLDGADEHNAPPPAELLEEDARELATRPGLAAALLRDELT